MQTFHLRPFSALALISALALGACGSGPADSNDDTDTQDSSSEPSMPQGSVAAPEDASVYFIDLEDGDTVSSPVTLRFGLENAGIAPAGTHQEGTGHHHLLVDVEDFATDRPLPSDDRHIHFGGGQTQTELELEPGEHTLQLVLGDWKHQPHDPVISSEKITITVE